ncbi:hypothetical protein LMH73_008685 [Vibrio splendidus]|nr:hypothetical protein [Vibrio splendidus]MCC4879457.1 hypothetical protein [Vibrio splendidus]
MKKDRTRVSEVKVDIDYGEYLIGYSFQVSIGNNLLAMDVKYPTIPTSKQLRKLKKAWYREMRSYDFVSIYRKKFCIKKGIFIQLK